MPELNPPPKFPELDWIGRKWLNQIYEKLRGPLWDDMLTAISSGKIGAANAPNWTAFGPTGTNFQWVFSLNDYIQLSGFHITHDVKPGSKIYPHIHWTTDGTDTNTVKWRLSYTLAKGHDQEAFPVDATRDLEQAGSGIAWQHMIVEVSDTAAIEVPEIDTIIILRLERVTNDGTDNTDDVFGIYVDLHYQKDRFGTPQKAPDFYKRGS